MKNRTHARKTPQVSNARNPLPSHPTPTLPRGRAFAADLRRKFGRLKGLVVKLVEAEDSFGLKEPTRFTVTGNEFNPDQPRDAQGRFGSGEYLKALSSLPAKLIDKVKSSAAAKYKSLSDRYGSKYAKAIIGAALLGLPVPLPGASFVTAGPVLAIAEMHRRFIGHKAAAVANEELDEALIRQAAADLVEELRREFAEYATPVTNCAVGQLRDATTGRCGPGIGVDIPRNEMPQIRNDDLKEFLQYVSEQGVSVGDSLVSAADLRPTQKEFRQDRVDKIPAKVLANPVIVSRDNYVLDGTHRWVKQWQQHPETLVKVLRIDLPLQQALDLMRKFPKSEFVDNTRWKFTTTPEQVKAFQEWLRTQLDDTLTGASEEELWRKYAEAGFRKGAGRAFDDTRAARRTQAAVDQSQLDFYAGTRDEFLRSSFGRPVAVEKIELLAGRSFDELENVTADMANRMSRELTDGLVEGKGPREIARDLADAVDIGRDRALVVARTEIVRCHAEGQLDALEALGVTEVGVMVEWSTTGDEKVCELCDPLEGVVLKIDEARNLLPRHPSCRCAWVPAQIGESDKDQIKGASAVREAVADSVREETPDAKESRWAGADLKVSPKRPEAVVSNVDDLIAYERTINSNPDQPRDDQGRFSIHPGVGKLRELFGAKGIPHEHLSDLDLHDILTQASAVTSPKASAPAGKKDKGDKTKDTKSPKDSVPAAEVSAHVERLTALRDKMDTLASDKGQSLDALESYIKATTGEVHETVTGLSHADLKAVGEGVGVIGAHRLGKGELVRQVVGRVTASAQGVLSIRQ